MGFGLLQDPGDGVAVPDDETRLEARAERRLGESPELVLELLVGRRLEGHRVEVRRERARRGPEGSHVEDGDLGLVPARHTHGPFQGTLRRVGEIARTHDAANLDHGLSPCAEPSSPFRAPEEDSRLLSSARTVSTGHDAPRTTWLAVEPTKPISA